MVIGAVVARVAVAEVEAILGVVAEVGVIDVRGEAGAWGRSDAVSVSSVALAVAGGCDLFRDISDCIRSIRWWSP